MKWTVVYLPSAQSELANHWMVAPDRQAVSNAADLADSILSIDPANAGESRDGIWRVLVEPPLAFHFDVMPDDRKVVIWHVDRW